MRSGRLVSPDRCRVGRLRRRIRQRSLLVQERRRKWSPRGGRVEVRLFKRELTVRDHGPGFLDGGIDHVFDRFFRADATRSNPAPGLALRS